MAKKEPITYADSRTDLPGNDFAQKLADLRIARLFAERSKATEQNNRPDYVRDASDVSRNTAPHPHRQDHPSMVAQEHPHPVLKPSPSLAADVDAAAFNARWEAERQRNTQSQPPQPNQGERPMSDDTTQPRRPEDTVREGPLKAAIWRNESENGAYHSVTVARTYKDRDGNLQDTQSFRSKDMLGLSELARCAHHHVNELDRAAFKEQRQGEAQEPSQTRDQSHSR
ncbi:MAG: hypothetical protein AAFQ58_24065 [Pseudomonadota bacterium]